MCKESHTMEKLQDKGVDMRTVCICSSSNRGVVVVTLVVRAAVTV